MKPFEYVRAETLEEAAKLAKAGGRLKAGGIDLLDLMKSSVETPDRLIDLLRVDGGGKVERRGNRFRIGALATLADVAAHEEVRRAFPALAQACSETATPQIRNRATLGGNLCQRPRCWYFRLREMNCLRKGGAVCYAVEGENRFHAVFDNSPCCIVSPSSTAVALAALGAVVEIVSEDGKRELPIDRFFLLPRQNVRQETALGVGEVVAAVRLEDRGWRNRYLEIRQRESFDFPLVSCAMSARFEGEKIAEAVVVLGAVSPVPRIASEVGKFLIGKEVTEETATRAAAMATEGATPLSQNGYKLPLLRAIVKRGILGLKA